jgi:uncharacterized protein
MTKGAMARRPVGDVDMTERCRGTGGQTELSSSDLAALKPGCFASSERIAMPSLPLSPYLLTVLLLVGSNCFMTTAWYWHLRFRELPLWQVVLISWGLALFEYWMAVPANRYGSYVYSAAQLKTIQEVITLTVFGVFSVVYLHQPVTWNQVIGFALIAGGAYFVFRAPI